MVEMNNLKSWQKYFLIFSKYITYTIYFLVPLIFSHLLYSFGIQTVIYQPGYESIKVYTFLGLISLGFLSFLIGSKGSLLEKIDKKIWIGIGIYVFIICLSSLFGIDMEVSILGSADKAHGGLMYIGLAGLFVQMVGSFEVLDYRRVVKILLVGSLVMFIFSLAEYLGIHPLLEFYSIQDGVVGTMGNANYLA